MNVPLSGQLELEIIVDKTRVEESYNQDLSKNMSVETIKERGRDSKRDKPQKDIEIILNGEGGFRSETSHRRDSKDYKGGDHLDNSINIEEEISCPSIPSNEEPNS